MERKLPKTFIILLISTLVSCKVQLPKPEFDINTNSHNIEEDTDDWALPKLPQKWDLFDALDPQHGAWNWDQPEWWELSRDGFTHHFNKADPSSALPLYDQALVLNPTDANTILLRAECLHAMGDLRAAENASLFGLALAPNDTKALTVAGRLAAGRGENHWGAVLLSQAIEKEPGNFWALNGLAWVYATGPEELRAADAALNVAKLAAELTNYEIPAILETVAYAYAGCKNFQRAFEYARLAVRTRSWYSSDEWQQARVFADRQLFADGDLDATRNRFGVALDQEQGLTEGALWENDRWPLEPRVNLQIPLFGSDD